MDGATLYIDHGSASTVAVLTWTSQRIDQVTFELPREDAATPPPTRPAINPPDRHGGNHTPVVSTSEPVADTTRILAEVVAAAQSRGPIDRIVLVVGAHRGPRWRADLRRSAQRAGIVNAQIVDGPEAVARQLTSPAATPTGTHVIVCDLGASGMEAAVYARTGDSIEMRSVVNTSTGGNAIDTLITSLPEPDKITVTQARAAKHALAHRARVHVDGSGDDEHAIAIDQATLAGVTGPVWDEYAQTIRTAIDGADLTITDMSAVYLIGGGANLPLAAQALRERLDLPVIVQTQPRHAAVLAAAGNDPTPPNAPAVSTPRWILPREMLGIALPGAAALLLFYQFLTNATAYPLTGNVEAPWGDLGLAATLTLVAATAVAATITTPNPAAAIHTTRSRAPVMTAAAVGALIIAVIYALIAQASIEIPGPYLKAVLLSAVPLAVAHVGLAHLPRQASAPVAVEAAGVSRQRTISIMFAAVGAFAAQAGYFGTFRIAGHDHLVWTLLERIGGGLLGAAFAILLSRRRTMLLYVIPALAFVGVLVIHIHTSNTITYVYVAALTLWTILHAIPSPQPPGPDRKQNTVTGSGHAMAAAPHDHHPTDQDQAPLTTT